MNLPAENGSLQPSSASSLVPLRVLYVEDRQEDVDLIAHQLRCSGFDPSGERVDTEEQFLAHLDPKLDVILSDLNIPGFGGLEALKLLKSSKFNLPFIFVSATIGEDVAVTAMQEGAFDYLLKDRLGRLGPAINQALDRWRLQEGKLLADQTAARLAAIVESSSDAIFATTLDGLILDWNPAAERLFGYPAAEVVGKSIGVIIPSSRRHSDEPEEHQDLEQHLRGGGVESYDAVRVRKDGRRIDVLVSISPIRNSDGGIIGASYIAHDITQRKRAGRFLAVGHAVTTILAESRTLEEAAPKLLQTLAEGLRWEVAVLWMVDSAANVLRRVHTWHAPWVEAGFVEMLECRTGLEPDAAIVVETGGSPVPCQQGQASRLSLRLEGRLVGAIDFYNPKVHKPDAPMLAALENIASQITQWGEKRASEAALHASEGQFRQLANAMPQIVWAAGPDGKIDYFNERWYHLTECQRGEFAWGAWRSFIHPGDRRRLRQAWTDSVQTGVPFEVECRFGQGQAGGYRWLLVRAMAAPGAGGSVTRWIGTGTDIDDQKRILETLRTSEERFRKLVMALPAAVYTTDAVGRITLFNEHAADLWGRRPELGKDLWDGAWKTFRLDGTPVALDQGPMALTLREGRGVRSVEIIVERPDGSKARVLPHPELLFDATGEIVGAVNMLIDLTQMKLLEEQFRQSQKMDAFGQMAGGIAHDFNNLLTLILGYSDLLLQTLPPNDPSRGAVKVIHDAGQRSAALTRQLLTFSRKQVVAPKVLDLNALVTNAEKMLRRMIGEDLIFQTDLAPNEVRVKADPGQIEQVLMNLAVNARDAMPQGGRLTIETVEVWLDEEYAQHHASVLPGRYARLAVSDTGSGIPPHVRSRIFEPFFTTKEVGKGTGLGLAVVHGIVKEAGGHAVVHSPGRGGEGGVGTTFEIYLPWVDQAALAVQPPPRRHVPMGGTETVLLVEDECGVRSMIRHILGDCGYSVLEAANGNEAIRVAGGHAGPIRLLVTDVVMPGLGGRHLADRILDSHPEARVLFVSGYTDDAVVRNGVLEDQVHFLQKPFSPLGLVQKVREMLDGPDS